MTNYKYKLNRRPNVESSDEYLAEVQAALDALPDEAIKKHDPNWNPDVHNLVALITWWTDMPQGFEFWDQAHRNFTVELIEHPCECKVCGAKL